MKQSYLVTMVNKDNARKLRAEKKKVRELLKKGDALIAQCRKILAECK